MTTYDLIAIGGGTAGLVTAAGAAALGAKVALIEREALGGDCLWTGCVPSKALIAFARRPQPGRQWPEAVAWLRAAQNRIAAHDDPARFRALGVEVVLGRARLAGADRVEVDGRLLRAKRLVLATGAAPAPPAIEGLEAAGYLTHRTAFSQRTLFPSVAILGGGPIGLEFAQTYARLGVKVTVLEFLPGILPREDPEAARVVRDQLLAEGIAVRTGFRAVKIESEGGSKVVCGEGGERVAAAELFVATGRRPELEDLDPARAGVEVEGGAVLVDQRLRTTQPGIWACGDVTGGPQFTHAAEYMARIVVQNALTPLPARVDYRLIPRVTFTDPELAAVGFTERELADRGQAYEVHRYDFQDLDRAIVDGAGQGFCKITTRKDGRILGATIVGRGAGEVIISLALAMHQGMSLQRLAAVVFPYPTMGEVVKRTAQHWYRVKYGDTLRGRLLRGLLRWWR